MSKAAYLLDLKTIRERCNKVANSNLQYWSTDESKLVDVTDFVLQLIARDYNNDTSLIRPHGRWSHFLVNGVDRISPLLNDTWKDVDVLEKARRMIDVSLVSVLLDAGAGTVWKYTEKCASPVPVGRSEGLAVASLDMFKDGFFSSNPSNKFQVDAKALSQITKDQIVQALQVNENNPMPGAEGRANLLIRLGDVLAAPENAAYFGAAQRPGAIIDYLIPLATEDKKIDLPFLWKIVIEGLAKIWPADESRMKLYGQTLGDVWLCDALFQDGKTRETATEEEKEQALVPFHKLSQWLCYSLVEVIETITPYSIAHKELQTGLPEYRNGSVFIDFGVFIPKLDAFTSSLSLPPVSDLLDLPPLPASHPAIVEWRALTVVYLDKILPQVNTKLGKTLTLAQVLEAGTWKAGREIAKQKRADKGAGSALNVLSDGTVF